LVHTREQLISDLRSGVLEIRYRKPDNQVATIKGTLNPTIVPEGAKAIIAREQATNESIRDVANVLIFDIIARDFKTLTVARVEDAQFVQTF